MADSDALDRALRATEQEHDPLRPRQVLGVRMGFAAAERLAVQPGERERRLLVLVETDGCFADGVSAATGCTVGHRTLRLMDNGRIAITAVNLETRAAVRLSPRVDVRANAARYTASEEAHHYYQQLHGYRVMPDHELLSIQPVTLNFDLDVLLGQRGIRVDCAGCGEEVVNGCEVVVASRPLCPACQAPAAAYYVADSLAVWPSAEVGVQGPR